jgi:PAP2 superfamily
VLAGTFLLAPFVLLKALRLARGERGGAFVPDFLYRNILAPERVARLLHVTIAMLVLQVAFSVIKRAIPVFHPFAFDRELAALDRWVHFGVDPYQLLLPVLGAPLVTYAFGFAYDAWFFVMSVFWVWQATVDKDGGIRFLLAFMLLWVIGSGGLGTVFSSVGPCYYAHLFPGDTLFEPLMNHLRAVDAIYPLSALDVQRMLWRGYASEAGMVHGISAMPSMHVGTAALFVLAAARGSMLRKLLLAYAVVIMLGSVLLAWHYAIDGYVGVALAVLAWKAAGRLVDWDRARRTPLTSPATVPAPI